jgi:hypothetical protein
MKPILHAFKVSHRKFFFLFTISLPFQVNATDKDFGDVGKLNYAIYSDEMQEYFSIDKDKGMIVTKKQLDRELKKVGIILLFYANCVSPH